MASLSTRRIGNSLTWSLQFTTRLKTICVSFSSSDRSRSYSCSRRSHHPRSRFQPPSRSFSSYDRLRQQTPAASSTAASAQARAPVVPNRVPKPDEPPPATARNVSANPPQEPIHILRTGLSDEPLAPASPIASTASTAVPSDQQVDWARSFHGLSTAAFSKEAAAILLAPVNSDDIEIKPDGILYLPEIKYRRILNRAFGPGAWGLAPRGETIITAKAVTREYALLAHGRLVSIARGEQDYFDADGIPTATEGCKSNALMRCCKDLGVASELWDPRFIRKWMAANTKEVWVEHAVTKKRRKMTLRKDDVVKYPFKETSGMAAPQGTARSYN